jgi:hypothetical protein
MTGQFKPGDRVRDSAVGMVLHWSDDGKWVAISFGGIPVWRSPSKIEPAPDAAGGEDLRDQIARIIDPKPFEVFDAEYERMRKWPADKRGPTHAMMFSHHDRERARKLADAILPLFASLQERVSHAVQSEREAQRDHTDMMWQRRRAEERADAAEARAIAAEQALEAEREACALIAAEWDSGWAEDRNTRTARITGEEIAYAIRSRSTSPSLAHKEGENG